MEQLKEQIEALSVHFDQIKPLRDISHKYKIPSAYIALGLIFSLFLFVLIGVGAKTIVYLIGFVYPSYMSFKAIEQKGMDDDKQWITYWVVFALFGLLDDWYEVLLWWLPFYYPIKLMVLTALFWPKRRGAEKLYDKTIRKIYIRYEETIDKAFESFMTKTQDLQGAVKNVADEAKQKAVEAGVELLKQEQLVIKQMQNQAYFKYDTNYTSVKVHQQPGGQSSIQLGWDDNKEQRRGNNRTNDSYNPPRQNQERWDRRGDDRDYYEENHDRGQRDQQDLRQYRNPPRQEMGRQDDYRGGYDQRGYNQRNEDARQYSNDWRQNRDLYPDRGQRFQDDREMYPDRGYQQRQQRDQRYNDDRELYPDRGYQQRQQRQNDNYDSRQDYQNRRNIDDRSQPLPKNNKPSFYRNADPDEYQPQYYRNQQQQKRQQDTRTSVKVHNPPGGASSVVIGDDSRRYY